MPAAIDVRPKKWSDLVVLFDNGWYSVVAGNYEGRPAMGERWNGEGGGLGFPSHGEYPTFHVVPEFLRLAILRGLYEKLRADRDLEGWSGYMKAVLDQLEVREAA
jgi:hypothetical protein